MYKGSIDIATINKSCKIRFGLIFADDNPKFKNMELISKFNYNGNKYLKIRPHPFITIDISSSSLDRGEAWNTNQSVNLNRKDLFLFIQKLKQIHAEFINEKNLFYYDENGALKVDSVLADKHKEIHKCSNGKALWMQPCVVQNEEDNLDYEGIFLCINSVDYFSYFTYTELEFLIEVLSEINMTELSMQMIIMAKFTENMKVDTIQMKAIQEVQQENEIVDIKPSFFRQPQKSTIPDI